MRQQKLFRKLVEAYADGHCPVASHQLGNCGCSSATVRNELAVLVAAGLIERAARNRGAIPTVQGWALYLSRTEQISVALDHADVSLLACQESASQLAHREAAQLAARLGGAVMVRYPEMGSYRIRDLHVVRHGWAPPPLMMLYVNGVQATADPLAGQPAIATLDAGDIAHSLEPELRVLGHGVTVREFWIALQRSGSARVECLGSGSRQEGGLRWLAALVLSLTDLIRQQKTVWEIVDPETLPDVNYAGLYQVVTDSEKHPERTSGWFRTDGTPVLFGQWERRYEGLMYVGVPWGQGYAPTGAIGFVGPIVPSIQHVVHQLCTAGERLRQRFYQPYPV